MAKEFYTITKYSYVEFLIDDLDGGVGAVGLSDENGRVASFRFMKSGLPFDPITYRPHGVIRGDIDSGKRDAIIDLLRNEGPVTLGVFHDGTPERVINWVWIGTRKCAPEEVGEGEG